MTASHDILDKYTIISHFPELRGIYNYFTLSGIKRNIQLFVLMSLFWEKLKILKM